MQSDSDCDSAAPNQQRNRNAVKGVGDTRECRSASDQTGSLIVPVQLRDEKLKLLSGPDLQREFDRDQIGPILLLS